VDRRKKMERNLMKSFIPFPDSDKTKEDEMGGACSTQG
jgi:hypothetical protein